MLVVMELGSQLDDKASGGWKVMKQGITHIWMSADQFDDIFIKVTSVAQEATGDVIGMSQALEDGVI